MLVSLKKGSKFTSLASTETFFLAQFELSLIAHF